MDIVCFSFDFEILAAYLCIPVACLYGRRAICYTKGNQMAKKRIGRYQTMRLNAPKKFTFWMSVVIFVVGMVAAFGVIPYVPPIAGVIAVIVGYVLLALGNILKGF